MYGIAGSHDTFFCPCFLLTSPAPPLEPLPNRLGVSPFLGDQYPSSKGNESGGGGLLNVGASPFLDLQSRRSVWAGLQTGVGRSLGPSVEGLLLGSSLGRV